MGRADRCDWIRDLRNVGASPVERRAGTAGASVSLSSVLCLAALPQEQPHCGRTALEPFERALLPQEQPHCGRAALEPFERALRARTCSVSRRTTRRRPKAMSPSTSLHDACASGRINDVILCLDRGDDIERADIDAGWYKHGMTPLLTACWKGHVDIMRLLLDRGAEVDRDRHDQVTPFQLACSNGFFDAARLCVERGADFKRADCNGRTSYDIVKRAVYDKAREGRLDERSTASMSAVYAMAAWLERIEVAGGWANYLSEPRYEMVILRALVASGRARRERAFFGKERVLDFLFPGAQPPPQAKEQVTQDPILPDDLFPLVARYYWGARAKRDIRMVI